MKIKLKVFSEQSVSIMFDILIKKYKEQKKYNYELVILKEMFKNYFNGKHYLENLGFIAKEKQAKNWLETKYKFFREVYTVANDNWSELKTLLNLIDITGKRYNFEYPGEFLSAILSEHYAVMFDENKHKQINKTRAKTLYLAFREYFKSKSQGVNQISEKSRVLIKRLKNHSDNDVKLTFLDILDTVISVSEKNRIENLQLALTEEKVKVLRRLF